MCLFQKPSLSVLFVASTQQRLNQVKEEQGEPVGLACQRDEAPGASALGNPPAVSSGAQVLIKDEQAPACTVCDALLPRDYRKVCKYFNIT